MSLRDLTHEKHKQAEQHIFVTQLFAKQLPVEVYADFLFNKMLRYAALEHKAKLMGVFDTLPDIARTAHMVKDLTTLSYPVYKKRESTTAYIHHIDSLTNPQDVLAHVYTLHMGDMYGGQMMKELVPTPGHMFDFPNRAELIKALREVLTDDMADEANRAFDFAIQLFQELKVAYDL